MTKHAVVIAGGGPTGLMLAGELKLAGVDVAIVERRVNQDLIGSRALGLKTRALELLDQRGIVDRFVSQGKKHPAVHFHIPLDITDLPTRHNYTLGLLQQHTERTLAEWVEQLKVPIYREREVVGFAQTDADVDIELSQGDSLRARYLIGCDGGRSAIRKAAGIEFVGSEASTSWLIAEVAFREEPKWGFHISASGIYATGRSDDGRARMVLQEREVSSSDDPTLPDVKETLIAGYGKDFGIHSPTWISRFTDMTRQATRYRDRRVLLAGDAAHVHAPLGGHGLNLGMEDAVNLGWKLAQVIKGISAESLLDTYHAERHPVAAHALRNTLAHVAVRRLDDRSKALGDYVDLMLKMDEPRRRMGAEMAGLSVHYDLSCAAEDFAKEAEGDCGKAHPLLGRRMPDLDLITANGPQRLYTFMHDARPVLLNLGEPGGLDITPRVERVHLVEARYEGDWELPMIGDVAAPEAALIRPDGHVAWVGNATRAGLSDALTFWFGPPQPLHRN